MIGMVIVGARCDDDVGLPLTYLADNLFGTFKRFRAECRAKKGSALSRQQRQISPDIPFYRTCPITAVHSAVARPQDESARPRGRRSRRGGRYPRAHRIRTRPLSHPQNGYQLETDPLRVLWHLRKQKRRKVDGRERHSPVQLPILEEGPLRSPRRRYSPLTIEQWVEAVFHVPESLTQVSLQMTVRARCLPWSSAS